LSLYPEAAYEEVFAVVSQGLAWASGAAQPALVAKSSISSLRSRIGSAPLSDLVKRCCVPLANARDHPQAFFADLRQSALRRRVASLPAKCARIGPDKAECLLLGGRGELLLMNGTLLHALPVRKKPLGLSCRCEGRPMGIRSVSSLPNAARARKRDIFARRPQLNCGLVAGSQARAQQR
jgi:hypothetical protein